VNGRMNMKQKIRSVEEVLKDVCVDRMVEKLD
jgi:hypothetical protein